MLTAFLLLTAPLWGPALFFGLIVLVDLETYDVNNIYVANTLIEKYPDSENEYEYIFRIELNNEENNGDILLKKVDEATYLSYKEGSPVNLYHFVKTEKATGNVVKQEYYIKAVSPDEAVPWF